tara:strand:+ start:2231 stop:2392 length:162 start_codon:yes stop_codon:yes gene_type:complete
MNLPPYVIFPIMSGEKISLRLLLTTDLEESIAISYDAAVKATTLQQTSEMQAK